MDFLSLPEKITMQKVIIFIALCAFGTVLGQQSASGPDDCLMNCMNDMYRKAPRMDAMRILDIEPIKVGNETAMCPKLNDSSQLEHSCAPMIQLKNCTDACPDTQVKKMSMGAYKAIQFVCIDRASDVKQNIPCLSQNCPEVQQTCIPKCGSVEGASMKIVNVLHQVHGASGSGGATTGGQNVDMGQIMKVMGDTCTTLSCFMECSEPPTTKMCSKDAYLLQRDFIWTMFSQVAQSMSSMGMQNQWPPQCQPLAAAAENATGVSAAAVPSQAEAPRAGSAVPTPIEATGPPVNTTEASAPAGNTTMETGASKQCEKPPCQGCMGMAPSTMLLAVTSIVILVFKAL